MKKNRFSIAGLLTILIMGLGACGPQVPGTEVTAFPGAGSGEQPATVGAVEAPAGGPKILHGSFGGAGDIPTIDPALSEDTASIQVVDETFIGLTHLDEETSATQAGVASSWDARTNADGTQTLTFHLRDDIPWVRWNGKAVEKVRTCDGSADRMVTAHDFVYGIRRNQDPATGSPYAYLLAFMLKGAAQFNNGVTSDFSTVGVQAPDDTTLEMTFLTPAVYNVQIAGLWVARAQPRWVIEGDCDGALEARGERWTEPGFFQSYGPFTLKAWIHDSSITLVKNPYWPGTDDIPQSSVDEVNIRMLDAGASLTEYETGSLDFIAMVPLTDIDRIKADPVLSKEWHVQPSSCSFHFDFNTRAPVVDDVRVRRALSLAVDRQSLIDNVMKGNQMAAPWFAVPGIAGVPTLEDYPELGVRYDAEKAKAELQSYLDEEKTTADKLRLTLMFASFPNQKQIAEVVQQMWKSTLGLNVELATQEWKVYLATTSGTDTPQIFAMGWCQDYPDANNWDREVFAVNGSANPADEQGEPVGGVSWRNDVFEKLVRDAAVESDPEKRVEMYARAEQILVWEDAVMIPVLWYSSTSLTKPYIIRTYGLDGQEAFEKWDVTPH